MLHFTKQELATRRDKAAGAMAARGLDGLLMFRQESMYYLTGYDTFGYVYFQCLCLGADGAMTTGQTLELTADGCAALSRAPLGLVVK